MKVAICVESLETLISWSVCACLACDLLQVVDTSILFDVEWMQADAVADASGNLCQVGYCELKRASWQSEAVSQNLTGSELFISFWVDA